MATATREVEVHYSTRIPGIVVELERGGEEVEREIANEIATDARRLAPKLAHAIVYPSFHREPGWLAESIEADEVPGGGSAIRVGAFWGIFQEYGTENMHPHPYLRPAAELHEVDLIRRTRTTLERLED
jgi:HK97 gp10 family phage protein